MRVSTGRHPFYCGVDLHASDLVAAAVVIAECRTRFARDLEPVGCWP